MLFTFSTPELIRNLWQLKTAVFLHWCLICALTHCEKTRIKTLNCSTKSTKGKNLKFIVNEINFLFFDGLKPLFVNALTFAQMTIDDHVNIMEQCILDTNAGKQLS